MATRIRLKRMGAKKAPFTAWSWQIPVLLVMDVL